VDLPFCRVVLTTAVKEVDRPDAGRCMTATFRSATRPWLRCSRSTTTGRYGQPPFVRMSEMPAPPVLIRAGRGKILLPRKLRM
jgi:hypothetical protein